MINRLLAVNIGTDTPLGKGSLGQTYSTPSVLISTIIKTSLTFAGVLLLVLLIFGGVSFIINAGGGDPKKAQAAKHTITSALIGFGIVFLAFAIIQLVQVITGLNILNPNI